MGDLRERLSFARASRRVASMHVENRRVAQGLVLGAAFVLVGRVAGAGKEMAIAWRYGAGGTVDAYQLAATLVSWVPATLASVATTLLVPLLVRSRGDEPAARERLLGQLNGAALLVGMVLLGVGAVAWPYMVGVLAAGLSDSTRSLAAETSLRLLPLGFLSLLVIVFSARLQARERHVNTLLEALPALALVVVVLASPIDAAAGPLVWGTVLGAALHATVLGWLATRADGRLGLPRPGPSSPRWRDVHGAVAILLLSQAALGLIAPIDQLMAARFGDSAIASLGYANRILALLIGLGALSIARATLPVFSESIAADAAAARVRALRWAWLMLAAGAAAAALAWGLMAWGVGLLFERGAFTSEDTARVAALARWGTLQLPFCFGGLVLVQLLAARGAVRPIAVSALIGLPVKLVLNVAAIRAFGFEGLLVATAAMYAVTFVYLLHAVHRDVR